ncbi:hypothetical protein C8J57DRAFT_1509770 [Mycena rebaudengoi]|nr:hypothetical protein C8J57DRAFT_1509770 [Mycena rebaudengoi]
MQLLLCSVLRLAPTLAAKKELHLDDASSSTVYLTADALSMSVHETTRAQHLLAKDADFRLRTIMWRCPFTQLCCTLRELHTVDDGNTYCL